MSLCRSFRLDSFARGSKAAASILFGTSGSSGVFAFETAKAFAGNRLSGKLARTNDASN